MNAQPKITLRGVSLPPVPGLADPLSQAFTASGIIRADQTGLERMSRALAVENLELRLAEAWQRERHPNRPDPDRSAYFADLRKKAHDAAAEQNRAMRRARMDRMMDLLRQGPMGIGDLMGALAMSRSTVRRMVRDACNEEAIRYVRLAGHGRSPVYEVCE